MGWIRPSFAALAVLSGALPTACGGDDGVTSCDDFEVPARLDTQSCDEPGSEPRELGACLLGSGYAGRWSVDTDGLPMYELSVEQRCDPAGQHGSAFGRGPIHLIGNGRGLTALAHASGAVEVFSQDRGHKFLNHVDTWQDPDAPEHPLQIGGGWSYVVTGSALRSTRHGDLAIGGAADQQVRRFGVGYVETVTRTGNLTIRRRVFAPDVDTRAVVAEVSVSNLAEDRRTIGLVELWDVNLHQLSGAFDPEVDPADLEGIHRSRRVLQEQFVHTASWSLEDRLAVVSSEAVQLPDTVARPEDPSRVDYFPDPVFLAVIDEGSAPDAVWLSDDEIWGPTPERDEPEQLKRDSSPESRELALEGGGQPAVLALRVPLDLPPGTTVTRRFAFGSVLENQTPQQAAQALRGRGVELAQQAAESWHQSLVWALFRGDDEAVAMQRELAWSSYYLQAAAGYDRQAQARVVSQAGALRYFYGVEGAIGDIALLAEPLSLIDRDLAGDSLAFALSSQHGAESPTQLRFPYGTTGIDDYIDPPGQEQRSDAYVLIPSAVATYLGFTRDTAFLERPISYWPRLLREAGSVVRHLGDAMQYIEGMLGAGEGGLLSMGTGDVTDGLTAEAGGPVGSVSSSFNAMVVGQRFDLVADVVAPVDADIAGAYQGLRDAQVSVLDSTASGTYYYRGFDGSGEPLLDDLVFALPQALAILSRVAVGEDAAALLDLFEDPLAGDFGIPTDSGAVSEAGPTLFGHVRPAISGWVGQAAPRADALRGWELFRRTFAYPRAELYPALWYGIWTGPESYVGSGERAGQVGRSLLTAYGEVPGLNIHGHAAPLRALIGVLGLTPTVDGIRIEPRVPGEVFHVVFPRLELRGTPSFIAGAVQVDGDEAMVLTVVVPSGLRATALRVFVDGQQIEAQVDGNEVIIELPEAADRMVSWSIESA